MLDQFDEYSIGMEGSLANKLKRYIAALEAERKDHADELTVAHMAGYEEGRDAEREKAKRLRALLQESQFHLNNWLCMHDCECDGIHRCGRHEVERTNDKISAALKETGDAIQD